MASSLELGVPQGDLAHDPGEVRGQDPLEAQGDLERPQGDLAHDPGEVCGQDPLEAQGEVMGDARCFALLAFQEEESPPIAPVDDPDPDHDPVHVADHGVDLVTGNELTDMKDWVGTWCWTCAMLPCVCWEKKLETRILVLSLLSEVLDKVAVPPVQHPDPLLHQHHQVGDNWIHCQELKSDEPSLTQMGSPTPLPMPHESPHPGPVIPLPPSRTKSPHVTDYIVTQTRIQKIQPGQDKPTHITYNTKTRIQHPKKNTPHLDTITLDKKKPPENLTLTVLKTQEKKRTPDKTLQKKPTPRRKKELIPDKNQPTMTDIMTFWKTKDKNAPNTPIPDNLPQHKNKNETLDRNTPVPDNPKPNTIDPRSNLTEPDSKAKKVRTRIQEIKDKFKEKGQLTPEPDKKTKVIPDKKRKLTRDLDSFDRVDSWKSRKLLAEGGCTWKRDVTDTGLIYKKYNPNIACFSNKEGQGDQAEGQSGAAGSEVDGWNQEGGAAPDARAELGGVALIRHQLKGGTRSQI